MQLGEEEKERQHETDIADAGDDERLARRQAVDKILVPEADEQIAAQADTFPADEERQQVAGQHQHQHRRDEQIHIGEEAVIAFVSGHEFGRVEQDQAADDGDDEHHHQRKRVEIEADRWREIADADPRPERQRYILVPTGKKNDGDQRGDDGGENDRADADNGDVPLRHAAFAQHQNHRGEKGQKRN